LYTDPKDDVEALAKLLIPEMPVSDDLTLRKLADSLGSKSKLSEVQQQVHEGPRFRRRALAVAFLALLAGVGIAALIYWSISGARQPL
jgi:hypothetical protein